MPDVRPFRAWRYDPAVAGPLDALICPPYDVVSPALAQQYLDRDAHNAMHLELGPGATDPSAPDNRYARAAATLDRWIAEGALRQDDIPYLYVYEQSFVLGGALRRRLAFFAAVHLTPWPAGEVLPHEGTLAAPKADRLALLEATRANVSPIYALCDAGLAGIEALLRVAAERPPQAEVVDGSGNDQEGHRLWAVSDPELIEEVRRDVAARPLYIADGHHRYETALAYAGSRGDDGDADGAGYVLMAITPANDPGLVVLPTHRLVRDLDDERLDYALARLYELFDITVVENVPPAGRLLAALASAGEQALALFTPGLARLLRPRRSAEALLAGLSPALRAVDAAVAQALLLDGLLGLTAVDLQGQRHVDYTRDADEALRLVDDDAYQAAVLLHGAAPSSILAVARTGARMPQKSTYFYPKLTTGLVLRRIG